jgi:hypothetical protein
MGNEGKIIELKLEASKLDLAYLTALKQKEYWEGRRKQALEAIEELLQGAAGGKMNGGVYYMRQVKTRQPYVIPAMTISFLKRIGPKPDQFRKAGEEDAEF